MRTGQHALSNEECQNENDNYLIEEEDEVGCVVRIELSSGRSCIDQETKVKKRA